jgi:hypothetical protein
MGFDAGFSSYRSTRLSRYDAVGLSTSLSTVVEHSAKATGPIHSSERPETLMSVADSLAARLAAIISLLVRRSWLASKATPTGRT